MSSSRGAVNGCGLALAIFMGAGCLGAPRQADPQETGRAESAASEGQLPPRPARREPAGSPVAPALAWRLEFRAPAGVEGPRMAELHLVHDPLMQFLDVAPGSAVMAAGKQVVVQPVDGSRLRVLVFSSANTTRIPAGDWFTLHFSGVPRSVRLVHEESQLAPSGTEINDTTVALVPVEVAP